MNKLNSYIKAFLKGIPIGFLPVLLGWFVSNTICYRILQLKYRVNNLPYIMGMALIFSITSARGYIEKVQLLSIQDKYEFILNLKKTLNKMKWNIIRIENDVIIVKPRLLDGFYRKKLILNISNNEVKIVGFKIYMKMLLKNLNEN